MPIKPDVAVTQNRPRMARPRREIDTSTYSGRFAARLRALRDKKGLTTRELAEQSGIPKGTLEAWECGCDGVS